MVWIGIYYFKRCEYFDQRDFDQRYFDQRCVHSYESHSKHPSFQMRESYAYHKKLVFHCTTCVQKCDRMWVSNKIYLNCVKYLNLGKISACHGRVQFNHTCTLLVIYKNSVEQLLTLLTILVLNFVCCFFQQSIQNQCC